VVRWTCWAEDAAAMGTTCARVALDVAAVRVFSVVDDDDGLLLSL
jgi:hypothetical protein